MTATVSKAGPYYTTPGSQIKFSDLRRDFRAQIRKATSGGSETFGNDTSDIKASELRRNTTNTNSNPIVPDCTENRTTVSVSPEQGISTSINWKVSQFRGSIKYYYIAQSDTDINFNINTQSWNNNLDRNIRKFLFIDGICGSNDATKPAARLNGTAFNLTVDTYGSILGASGRGGGTGSGADLISGQKGGDAIEMTSPSGANNIVKVRTGGKIYAGGGGGEKGKTGNNGSNGNCYDSFTNYGGCGCPGCPSGWTDGGCGQNYGNHCDRKQVCGCWGDCWWESNGDSKYNSCYKNYTVNGGAGGEGGNGGPGRGYNNQSGSLDGATGAAGGSGQTCYDGGSYTTTPSNGDQGETGAAGSEWGIAGNNSNNTGNGGAAGKAIFGSNYTVEPTNPSENLVKGSV